MSPIMQREIANLIGRERSNIRMDYTPFDVQLYARSLIVALTGTWHFSAITLNVHLYHDVRWTQEDVDRYRRVLEEVFGIELAIVPFFCARTVGDVCERVTRALVREGRMRSGAPPAA